MIAIRQLQERDALEATNLWASSMRGSNCGDFQEKINRFVELKLNDENDMGNLFRNYVQAENGEKKGGITSCHQNQLASQTKGKDGNGKGLRGMHASQFFETEEGMQWLRRLVLASVLIFGLHGNIGAGVMSSFFEAINVIAFIGLSVLALLLKSCIFLMVLSCKKNHFL